MKTTARPIAATILACLLSLSALAGDMHTTITNPPPQDPAPQINQTNPNISQPEPEPDTVSDPIMEAILAFLPTLLAGF